MKLLLHFFNKEHIVIGINSHPINIKGKYNIFKLPITILSNKVCIQTIIAIFLNPKTLLYNISKNTVNCTLGINVNTSSWTNNIAEKLQLW